MPPAAYRELQENAPEALTIRILSARISTTERRASDRGSATESRVASTLADYDARVEKVERSATGLVPGTVIRIHYVSETHRPPLPGPRPIPVLQAGRTVPAYLRKSAEGSGYVPAARGASFEEVK